MFNDFFLSALSSSFMFKSKGRDCVVIKKYVHNEMTCHSKKILKSVENNNEVCKNNDNLNTDHDGKFSKVIKDFLY